MATVTIQTPYTVADTLGKEVTGGAITVLLLIDEPKVVSLADADKLWTEQIAALEQFVAMMKALPLPSVTPDRGRPS